MCFRCPHMANVNNKTELEDRLASLRKERDATLSELATITRDDQTQFYASQEIRINYQSVENYLTTIYERGWKVNENFSVPDLMSITSQHCRKLNFHLKGHLKNGRNIPEEVKEGRFCSLFFSFYQKTES